MIAKVDRRQQKFDAWLDRRRAASETLADFDQGVLKDMLGEQYCALVGMDSVVRDIAPDVVQEWRAQRSGEHGRLR